MIGGGWSASVGFISTSETWTGKSGQVSETFWHGLLQVPKYYIFFGFSSIWAFQPCMLWRNFWGRRGWSGRSDRADPARFRKCGVGSRSAWLWSGQFRSGVPDRPIGVGSVRSGTTKVRGTDPPIRGTDGLFFQKNPPFRKNLFCPQFWGWNGCANLMGAWKNCVVSVGVFGGGGEFWVFLGGGECQFYFYGREDFSDFYLEDVSAPKKNISPPPPKKFPNSPQTPSRPLDPSPSWRPPLLGFSIKNRTPPALALQTPPFPLPEQKKIKYPKRPPSLIVENASHCKGRGSVGTPKVLEWPKFGGQKRHSQASVLSCTRLRVPPVALRVSQLISWILKRFPGVAPVSRYTP